MKLKFGQILKLNVGQDLHKNDTAYILHSYFSEILNPWVHATEYAWVCFAFGNVNHRGHLKVTISYFAMFYRRCGRSISSISYSSFPTIFPSISYSALFAIFRESNPRCLCSTPSICSDPPKAHITIGFSISSAICTQIYL